MKKGTIAVVIIALIALGIFFVVKRGDAPSQKPGGNGYEITETGEEIANEEQVSRPWIEVLSSNVYVKTSDSWELINTGDQFDNGTTIRTDESGLAEIHMPDGSAVRLDSQSEIVLTQSDYDESSETLQVKIALSAGRVWSKIIELATPESFWEVETSNAVAAVRGTSFGMEYSDDESQVIGSENTVEVEAVDPESKQRLGRVAITPNKMIKIHRDLIKQIRDKRLSLTGEVKEVPEELQNMQWVSRAILADQVIKRRIEALKARGVDLAEIRQIIRDELRAKRQELLIRLKNQGILPRLFQPPTGTIVTAPIVEPVTKPVIEPVQTSTNSVELLDVNVR